MGDQPENAGEGVRVELPGREALLDPSLVPKCILAKIEMRDEYTFKKTKANKPLELILLDHSQTEATARMAQE